ncbi:hypothetical protein OG21DRAFT_895983 [Imleria badia]|nr:hypothetical protein OG21DRAFT_895983 [Imleria badia]
MPPPVECILQRKLNQAHARRFLHSYIRYVLPPVALTSRRWHGNLQGWAIADDIDHAALLDHSVVRVQDMHYRYCSQLQCSVLELVHLPRMLIHLQWRSTLNRSPLVTPFALPTTNYSKDRRELLSRKIFLCSSPGFRARFRCDRRLRTCARKNTPTFTTMNDEKI